MFVIYWARLTLLVSWLVAHGPILTLIGLIALLLVGLVFALLSSLFALAEYCHRDSAERPLPGPGRRPGRAAIPHRRVAVHRIGSAVAIQQRGQKGEMGRWVI
jgi:hypothetical protein